jgi:hypothetical protein
MIAAMDHITSATIQRLMRAHHKTISGLAASMGITHARVRQVRAQGVRGRVYVMDWMEAITGNCAAGWADVTRAYL